MSSKTASGARGERQVTILLHDDLGTIHYKHYKLTEGAVTVRHPATSQATDAPEATDAPGIRIES
jgi:hypothetical protein